jgi:peptidoglycan/xylan/chitin deacetylase (PgdA/CDA1 family)
MYRRIYNQVVLFTTLIMFEFALHSQTIDPPYEVGLWRGFCSAAISYTFDDGTAKQFSVAIPIFNEFNFDATLFTVTSWNPDWTTLQNAASEGHEIASHTVHHQYLNEHTAEYQDNELRESKNTINSEISGQECITLAYPYCVPAIDTICRKYYIAAQYPNRFFKYKLHYMR